MMNSNIVVLEEIQPRIFLAKFHKHYHMSMCLIRFNEFSEHHIFGSATGFPATLEMFKEFETRSGGYPLHYTYPEDWGGFALDGKAIQKVIKRGIPDPSNGDMIMMSLYAICNTEYPDNKYCIIAMSSEYDDKTLEHETAHALYANNKKYRKKVNKLFNLLDDDFRNIFLQVLCQWEYGNKYWVDEANAYLATNSNSMEELTTLNKFHNLKKISKPFRDLFNKYNKVDGFERRTLLPHMEWIR